MKIKLLGTGAAEGIPAFCCKCAVCVEAEKKGGKEIRRRSGTLIDDDMLIEFSPDIYMHRINNKLDFMKIRSIVLSHSHSDHLNERDLLMMVAPVFAVREPYPIYVYGNESVKQHYESAKFSEFDKQLPFVLLEEGKEVQIGNKTVLPLKADHDSGQKCFVFIISDGKKTVLYGHDSGYYPESTWEAFKKYKFDLAILDSVCGITSDSRHGHMGFITNIEVKKRMLEEGIADKSTKFVITHFSHNAKSTHSMLEVEGAKYGLEPAFDGMDIDV
jgi:phosphoribosyl 1,2-cyclic phosphate phosphodiesterase